MRILRRLTIIILCISVIVFGIYYGLKKWTSDDTVPVISCNTDEIEISIYADEAELYDGVTAWDDKDGDITDRVFIESISNFIRSGVCNVTYCVVDNDNHVAKLSRRVTYTDYEAPQFTVSSALVFAQGQTFSVLDYVGATDSIDGDISGKVKLVSSTVDTTAEGEYDIEVSATNSYGDVISLTLPVTVTAADELAIDIELSTYLVYIELGDSINPEDYIESVTGYYGEDLDTDCVSVKSAADINTPGVYTVRFSAEDENGNKGMTEMTVVVKE